MELKDKLLKLRKEHHFSQQQLADQLDVSRQSVSKWELGESQPDINNIIMLSEIYKVSTDYLLKDTIQEDNQPKQTQIFLVISTILVLLGNIVGFMLWRYYQNSLSLTAGILIEILGILLFEYFALKEHDEKAQKTFFSINIWLLNLIPIKYFVEFTVTFQYLYQRLYAMVDGRIGTIIVFYFPIIISLGLSAILFLLIRKVF